MNILQPTSPCQAIDVSVDTFFLIVIHGEQASIIIRPPSRIKKINSVPNNPGNAVYFIVTLKMYRISIVFHFGRNQKQMSGHRDADDGQQSVSP